MKQKITKRFGPLSYEVAARKIANDRVYLLLRFSFLKDAKITRKRILEKFIDETNAIGMIEWWTRGSIVKKPQLQFYGILVLKAS